jgi:hypothetical protein
MFGYGIYINFLKFRGFRGIFPWRFLLFPPHPLPLLMLLSMFWPEVWFIASKDSSEPIAGCALKNSGFWLLASGSYRIKI